MSMSTDISILVGHGILIEMTRASSRRLHSLDFDLQGDVERFQHTTRCVFVAATPYT